MTKPQKIIAQINKNVKQKKWKCLFNDCDEVAIKSHLIQRNGILSNISENGHLVEVRMVDAYKWNKKDSPISFQIVGIKQALSHKIFCNKHDTDIFRPIEKKPVNFEAYDSFLLFSYRAVCAEIRKKVVVIEQYSRLLKANTLKNRIDSNQLKLTIQGNQIGIEDLDALKNMLYDEIDKKEGTFTYFSYKYDKLDIYASAAFSATDIGEPRENRKPDLENIYIHILPLSDNTIILIGYHNNYASKETIEYCKSWAGLTKKKLELKLTRLFAKNIENWGISISQNKLLKDKNKRDYIDILKKNVDSFGISESSNFNLFE